MTEVGEHPGARTTVEGAVAGPRPRHGLRRALRLAALCGNLLYAGGGLVAVGVLLGLGSAPWQAYRNLLFAIALLVVTLVLNVKASVRTLGTVASVFAIALNLACLGYFLFGPEYSSVGLAALVALVPLLNVAAILSGRDRGRRRAG